MPDSFTTPRLAAEKLNDGHLADLVALHLDPEVSRYLGGVRSAEVTRTYLAANIAHWDRHGFGLWVFHTPEGAFVGRAGIRHLAVEGSDEIEIAYALERRFWGQGLASEFAQALTALGLGPLGLKSLIGIASVGNLASRRVLKTSGFAFERTALHHSEEVMFYRRRADEA